MGEDSSDSSDLDESRVVMSRCNVRLRTWLGCKRFRASATACVCTRCGAMLVGFEPSRSSDRTALCAKQGAPLYATHAVLWLRRRPVTWSLRRTPRCHVKHWTAKGVLPFQEWEVVSSAFSCTRISSAATNFTVDTDTICRRRKTSRQEFTHHSVRGRPIY